MMDLYGSVFKTALFPTWESVVRRRPTLGYLRRLEESQWAPLSEILDLQDAALRRLVTHAYQNVPFYRSRFEEAGIRPESVRGIDDLGDLPPLTRERAQESFEARKSTKEPLPEIFKMTSGTTGQPLAFGYDSDSEYWRQAMKLRGYRWAGYEPGDPVIHFWGSLDALYQKTWQKRVKVGLDRRLKRELYVDSNRRTDESLARVVELIERTKPTALICFSQAGAALARYVNEKGARRWGDIAVICGAEKLFEADREAIARAFGPAVFETYGSREFMLIGTECERHEGLHTSMETLVVEVLVREGSSYRAAVPGEAGEIAVTDLHNYGLPFIRYLTGDLGIAEEPGRCPCGRELVRLRSIEGRRNDTLKDGAGNAVDSLFLNVLFSVLADKVRHFQAVQHQDLSVDLKIVPTAAFDDRVLHDVRQNCEKFLQGVDLRTHLVPHIAPGKNGKLRVVVVE